MALTTTTDSTATTIEPPMFGSWGFGNELVLYAAMRDRGIEPEVDAEIIQQPFDMSLLLNREIDAAQGKSYNEYAMLLEATNPDTGELYQPEDFNVIDLGVEGYLTLEDAIYARGGWLDDPANADIAARFVAASMEGWIYCSDEFDACVDIVLDNGSTLGQGHMTWMLNEINQLIWPASEGIGALDAASWDETLRVAIDSDTISGPPSDGADQTEINDAALALLADSGLDLRGESYAPIEVTVIPGGE
jgi:NitT/TauT family transport system substrate-binding protein